MQRTAGRESGSRKHPASAGYSEDRERSSSHCQKTATKVKTQSILSPLKSWQMGKQTHERKRTATQNTGRNEKKKGKKRNEEKF